MGRVEARLREQLTDTFEAAAYPVTDPFDLVPVLPDGPGTQFEAGDVTVSAMDLATHGEYQDFPYESAEALVDDVVEGLKAEGVIEE
ncbi:MAG: MTH865 family protein [Halobacteriaceae archaeon]